MKVTLGKEVMKSIKKVRKLDPHMSKCEALDYLVKCGHTFTAVAICLEQGNQYTMELRDDTILLKKVRGDG